MFYDRKRFFDSIRATLPLNKSLTQDQVDGFNALLSEGESRNTSTEWIAYILATAWHETATRMQPVRETLASSDAQAIANLNRAYPNVANKYWVNGYFGRGYVQLTWDYNYKTMGKWLGIDLYANPSLALDPKIAVKIIYEGMIRGMFTAKKLSDYLDNVIQSDQQEFEEYTKARAIVNGHDRDKLIAGYALTIQKALYPARMVTVGNTAAPSVSGIGESSPADNASPAPIPVPPAPQNEPTSLVQNATVWAALGGFMTTVITALSGLSPVVQVLLIILSFGFLFWIVWQVFKGTKSVDRLI